ncbi:YoaK family protein [Peredibacter sp. HCB2-198]|uniref:YoaK family protein n=1 Tax=Peredibacter sp. HCB2-198 TaxID=3383025 RepID=UPI0038B48CC6
MIHCFLSDLYKKKFVVLWMLLSFKAGYLNAAGFLATGKFVSHVTGFGTQMGVSLAHEDYYFGAELLIIPLAFIFGSMIPSLILDRNYDEGKIPPYPMVQFLITMLLGVIFFLGTSGWFGDFSTPSDDLHDIILIGLLCFVCGMKNGLTTWATYGKIRTTHLTGLATDIGLHLPKLFRGGHKSRFPEPRRVNTVRLATFVSFSIGSLVAAFIFPNFGYSGFIFPFVLSVGLLAISFINYNEAKKEQGMTHEKAKVA